MNIGIYLYDQAEVLDFSGPYGVFSTAARLCSPLQPFEVFLVSESGRTVTARGGFSVNPAYSFLNHPPIDVMIIAGGEHQAELSKSAVLRWIKTTSAQAQHVASVCTGAFLLAQAGVLHHQRATTHWEDIPDLRAAYPDLQVLEQQRWVEDGKFISSAGISAGIDMSLYLLSKIHSRTLAEQTARQMEFSWTLNS